MSDTSVQSMEEAKYACTNLFFYVQICFLLSGCFFKHSPSYSNIPEKGKFVMSEKILDATEEQLQSAQAKITYLGEQEKPIHTVIFFTEVHTVALDHFTSVQRSPEPYTNDGLPYTKQFSVTAKEFQRVLSAVKPIVTKIDAAKGPEFISFSVTRNTDVGFEGHEFRIGPASARPFYQNLIDALDTQNRFGRDVLIRQFTNIYPE